jgi:hypothetical protein
MEELLIFQRLVKFNIATIRFTRVMRELVRQAVFIEDFPRTTGELAKISAMCAIIISQELSAGF